MDILYTVYIVQLLGVVECHNIDVLMFDLEPGQWDTEGASES